MAEEMVPNPRHAQLVELLKEVHSRSQEVGKAYQRVYASMQSEKVWTGPTAKKWTNEVGDNDHRLAQLVRQIVHAIEEELHRHPASVTRSQAELIRRQLAGRP
ncbi:hypothetical protein [Sphaerimonospora thailandensis]|uniref:Uncharacterized protein n=1 Tax=Sphaerimonospora thailandensis TaxID=795644 RepID=A0A8J3R8P1_9ACTN|nr:hypothetical protein [Sphaerimonospora thailandensis]GIH70109.1 hypothetical protein Mth01_23620 [Sphaerimonospora thailandensis]